MAVSRRQDRAATSFRPIKFLRSFTKNAPGSVLATAGDTKILCTVSIQESVPMWRKEEGGAWLTAEYGMVPGSTHTRKPREGRTPRVDGRSLEIGRLIGRSLRSVVDLKSMPEFTLWVDCEVLSADGGTRTTAINGASVALFDALLWLEERKKIRKWPLRAEVAATSIGLVGGQMLVDLDYEEDSQADVDLNVVRTSRGELVEVQGCAEGAPFTDDQLQEMLALAKTACEEINQVQKSCLGL